MRGNKKAANRKGLAAQDRSDSYFFYGLSFLYILISMGLYFLQYGFQSSDEVIHILLGQYQWREDAENVGAGATGEAVLLVDELAAHFLVRSVEYGAYHQATATNLCDMAVALLQFLQLGDEIFTNLMRILYQVLLLEDIENGESGSTCQVVATEGSSQLTIYRCKLRRNQYTTHRETIADTLGYGDEVWLDAQPLVSEELTASTITALDFIADEESAVFLAGSLQALSKFRSYHVAATYALDRLDDTSTYIALGKFLFPSLQIVDRKIGYVTIVIDWCDDLRIIGYLYGKGCSAVESLLYRKHAGSSVGE